MEKLNVNPTRMELGKLKSKLVIAKKGHKLLKDKQDELMRIFISMIKNNKKLRKITEEKITQSLKKFVLARAVMEDLSYEEAFYLPKKTYKLGLKKKNVMSVKIPDIILDKNLENSELSSIYPYSYANTSVDLDEALIILNTLMPEMIKLSELEKSCQLMADEIEKTRRRVNALEYMTIPQLEETIKFIKMKLDENDRASVIRLMKANIK